MNKQITAFAYALANVHGRNAEVRHAALPRAGRNVTLIAAAAVICTLLTFADASRADTLIDQHAVMAGNVTPGDAPGFPLTLSRPGHYVLGSDLIVTGDSSGIVITAPGVTLDMNGHRLSGSVRCIEAEATNEVRCDAPSQFSARVGISTVGASDTVIRNGAVAGFAGLGVHYGEGTTLEDMIVSANAGVGIGGGAYAATSVLRNVQVKQNGGAGLVCENMRVEHSSFNANGGDGIDCLSSSFADSDSRDNMGYGVAQGMTVGVRSQHNRAGEADAVATAQSAVATFKQ